MTGGRAVRDRQVNWNLPAPPGFQGLRDELPISFYEQNLPHWRQDGATYFTTFRLNDSLPVSKLRELRALKAELERRHSNAHGPTQSARERIESRDGIVSELMRQVEVWLDQGMGCCCLRSKEVSQIVAAAMHETNDKRCELGCFVVMPNHVHAIACPLTPADDPLENIVRSWKGVAAIKINEILGRSGSLWQRESFDRIIRDEEHLWRAVQYLGGNPRRARLAPDDARLWIRDDWTQLGWRFE
jgi:putative transposase